MLKQGSGCFFQCHVWLLLLIKTTEFNIGKSRCDFQRCKSVFVEEAIEVKFQLFQCPDVLLESDHYFRSKELYGSEWNFTFRIQHGGFTGRWNGVELPVYQY